jgi:catechol 2,3-dioxygenase-like lactoylglutathione lyase family enzyme
MAEPGGLKVVTIEVPVRDLERAVAWYRSVLGFEQVSSEGFSALLRPPGGQGPRLFLVETLDGRRLAFSSTRTGVVHSTIVFYTADLQAFHDRLVALRVHADELKPGAHSFGFRDPDGNRLGASDAEA